MNLRHKNLKLIFLITLLFTIFLPNIVPFIHILYIIPFLVISLYQRSLVTCLWYALLCGVGIDLLSDTERLGFHAMTFSFTTFLIYPQKKNFFSDSMTTLPIMTFFYSVISTLLEVTYLSLIGHLPAITIKWAITDMIIMPAFDSAYAFTIFILPFTIFGKRQRKGTDYFMNNE